MQLIIAGRNLQMAPSFFEKLRTYRYREDVGIFNQLPESDLHEILAAAYGWIILPGLQHSVSFLNAFRLHVPVIAHSPKGGPGHEWGGDAALYADLSNHEQVADRLKLLYTDEKFRETMIRKGMVRDQLFSRENCMGQLMKGVRRCIKN